jgi:hypothetical protein
MRAGFDDQGSGVDMAESTARLEVRLPCRLPGVQRGDRYEDPLAYFLEAGFPGSRVIGGGTLLSPEGEPLSCGIDADVLGEADEILDSVATFLDELGSPRGSTASIAGATTRTFGTTEGLALYLDGTGLAPDVYAANDINEFLDQLHESLGDRGGMQSFWEGPSETAVYLYGPSADSMREAITPLLIAHPLAESSRLVQIA